MLTTTKAHRKYPFGICINDRLRNTFNALEETKTCVLHKSVAKLYLKATGLCNIEDMLIGYARVSKAEKQDAAAQIADLQAAGVGRIYQGYCRRTPKNDDFGVY